MDVKSQTGEGSCNEDAHVVFPAKQCMWCVDWPHSREDNFNEIHAIVTAQLVLTSRMASQRMMVRNVSLFTESQMAGLAAMTRREYC